MASRCQITHSQAQCSNDYSLFRVISVRVEGQYLRLKGPSLIVGWTEGYGARVPCLFWFDAEENGEGTQGLICMK